MITVNSHISVGEREIEPVVARLSSIYELASAPEGGPVDDRVSDRALTPAWCIGETLAACGGYDLMWLAFKAVEERNGPACAEWLDRAWDGITIPGLVLWSATREERAGA